MKTLIITIIVMLILAGVSLNAIVGDNGIITNAQNATIEESCAALEEYLKQLYVEEVANEEVDLNEKNSMSPILILRNKYPNYFYYTSLGFVLNDKYALYCINKNGLPNEIKKQLKGGDAGNKTYYDYSNLNDVYGVTEDLKVYYSSGGLDSMVGATIADLGEDDPSRVVANSSSSSIGNSLSSYDVNNDGYISSGEARAIKNVNLEGSSLTSLSELNNLSNLRTLKLNNANLNNLDGIDRCPKLYYIYLKNCIIQDYSKIKGLMNQLKYLILIDVDDSEISKLCSNDNGIAGVDFVNLNYLAITGNTDEEDMFSNRCWSDSLTNSYVRGGRNVTKYITTLSPLGNLSLNTQNAVKYLNIDSNELINLNGLENFNNLCLIRAVRNKLEDISLLRNKEKLSWISMYSNNINSLEWITNKNSILYFDLMYNKLTSLKGIGNAINIQRIFCGNNLLGYGVEDDGSSNNETDSLFDIVNCKKLYLFEALNNKNLIWVDYLKNITSIKYLYLDGCININASSIAKLSTIINNWIKGSYPSKYELALIDKDTINVIISNKNISKSIFESYIPKYSGTELISGLGKIEKLDMININFTDDNGVKLSNTEVNELIVKVLKSLTTLKYLRIYASNSNYNISELSTDEFIGENKLMNLVELYINYVSIDNLSNLNNYSSKLRNLVIRNNRVKFNFGTIQDAINNIYNNYLSLGGKGSEFNSVGNFAGLNFDKSVSSNFINLDKVNGLYCSYCLSNESVIDLTGFTNLKAVVGYRWFEGSTILKLPRSLTEFNLTHPGYAYEDFSLCTSLKNIYLDDHADFDYNDLLHVCESIKNMFDNAKNEGKENFSLDCLRITSCWANTVSSFDFLEPLKELNIYEFQAYFAGRENINECSGLGYLNKIKTITITGVLFSKLDGLTPIYENGVLIKGCPDLEKFICGNGNNLMDISNLGSCTNLKSITVYSSSVNNIYGFQNLNKLEYLYLKNNSLTNVSSYIDDNGKSHNYNVLEIFANLNKNGALKKLYIGDNNFDSLSQISNLNWQERDF